MKRYKNSERFDRSKLLIGAYYLMPYAQTEEHIRKLAEANIDFIVAEPRNEWLLDTLHKYGIGIFPKGILPQDESRGTALAMTVEAYEQAAREYVDHPAIWGPFVGDEPSGSQFPVYGELIAALGRLFPGQTPHFNLCGNCFQDFYTWGVDPVKHFEAENYGEIADMCVKYIDLDYISFDNYVYVVPIATYLENFAIIADRCRKNGRDMWFTPQCNNQDGKYVVTENMMRYQVYVALAHGCRAITWACWTKGWWEMNVVDEYGNTTEQFPKVCKINRELKSVGEVYMAYENKSTHYLGFDGTPYLSYVDQKDGSVFSLQSENGIELGDFRGVTVEDGCAVVGYFEKEDGEGALMIADHSDPRDLGEVIATVSFQTDKKVTALYNGSPIEIQNQDGVYRLAISHSCGVFITLS